MKWLLHSHVYDIFAVIIVARLAALIHEHASDFNLAPQMLIVEAAILDRVHDGCAQVSVEAWPVFAHVVPEIACIRRDVRRRPRFISLTSRQNNATLALRGSFRDTHGVHVGFIDHLRCVVLWRYSWGHPWKFDG